jgi:hypothetical protein
VILYGSGEPFCSIVAWAFFSNQSKTPRSAERMLNRWGNTNCALSVLRSWETTAFATALGSMAVFL